MKKKIKDLSRNDINKICYSYGDFCSDKCPLYRLKKNRRKLCIIVLLNCKTNRAEKEALEREIEVKENMD